MPSWYFRMHYLVGYIKIRQDYIRILHGHIRIQHDYKRTRHDFILFYSLAMSVYSVAVVATVGTICTVALNTTSYIDTKYFIITLCIVAAITGNLLLMFVPKVR